MSTDGEKANVRLIIRLYEEKKEEQELVKSFISFWLIKSLLQSE